MQKQEKIPKPANNEYSIEQEVADLYLPVIPEPEQIRRPKRDRLPPARLIYAAPGHSGNYFVQSVFPQKPLEIVQGQFPVVPPVLVNTMFIPGGNRMLPNL